MPELAVERVFCCLKNTAPDCCRMQVMTKTASDDLDVFFCEGGSGTLLGHYKFYFDLGFPYLVVNGINSTVRDICQLMKGVVFGVLLRDTCILVDSDTSACMEICAKIMICCYGRLSQTHEYDKRSRH